MIRCAAQQRSSSPCSLLHPLIFVLLSSALPPFPTASVVSSSPQMHRSVRKAIASSPDRWQELGVSAIMTPGEAVAVVEDSASSIPRALRTMVERRFRHAPVVEARGALTASIAAGLSSLASFLLGGGGGGSSSSAASLRRVKGMVDVTTVLRVLSEHEKQRDRERARAAAAAAALGSPAGGSKGSAFFSPPPAAPGAGAGKTPGAAAGAGKTALRARRGSNSLGEDEELPEDDDAHEHGTAAAPAFGSTVRRGEGLLAGIAAGAGAGAGAAAGEAAGVGAFRDRRGSTASLASAGGAGDRGDDARSCASSDAHLTTGAGAGPSAGGGGGRGRSSSLASSSTGGAGSTASSTGHTASAAGGSRLPPAAASAQHRLLFDLADTGDQAIISFISAAFAAVRSAGGTAQAQTQGAATVSARRATAILQKLQAVREEAGAFTAIILMMITIVAGSRRCVWCRYNSFCCSCVYASHYCFLSYVSNHYCCCSVWATHHSRDSARPARPRSLYRAAVPRTGGQGAACSDCASRA